MDETEFLIVSVCVTVVLVVSLITDCIKQKSKDRYWQELNEQTRRKERENKTLQGEGGEYEYKDIGNGRGWLNREKNK